MGERFILDEIIAPVQMRRLAKVTMVTQFKKKIVAGLDKTKNA